MKILDWIFAARPMLHLPVWSVYLVSLRYHNELSGDRFNFQNLVALTALSLLVSGAYYLNQIYDEETDRWNHKLLFLQEGKLSKGNLMVGYVLISIVGLALGWTLSRLAFVICLQLFLLGFLYSAEPFRLKDRPILGLLTNAWSFGFLVSIFVMPNLTFHNAGLLGWDNPFYFAGAIGGIHALTTILDRSGDKLVGKRTLVVAAGSHGAAAVGACCLAFSVYVGIRSHFPVLIYLAVGATLLALLATIRPNPRTVKLAIVAPILALTVFAGVTYPAYLLFIVVLVIATRIYYRRRFGMTYPSLTR